MAVFEIALRPELRAALRQPPIVLPAGIRWGALGGSVTPGIVTAYEEHPCESESFSRTCPAQLAIARLCHLLALRSTLREATTTESIECGSLAVPRRRQ